jgi:hypothetical protein
LASNQLIEHDDSDLCLKTSFGVRLSIEFVSRFVSWFVGIVNFKNLTAEDSWEISAFFRRLDVRAMVDRLII